MKDHTLYCVQCDEAFLYSVREQTRHERHGFDAPRRCPSCRQHRVRLDELEAGRKFRRKPHAQRRPNHDKVLAYL
jgi:hypothetical protein